MRECVNVKMRGELTFRFPGSFTPFSLCDISVCIMQKTRSVLRQLIGLFLCVQKINNKSQN